MTRTIRELGSGTGIEKGMTYQRDAKDKSAWKRRSASDPLGPNSEIGRKLRQYYDELVSEEIPDRFSQLLQELEGNELPQSVVKKD